MASNLRLAGLAAAFLATGGALGAQAAPAAAAAPRFAYINSQAILAAAPGRQEAEAQFTREMEGFRGQIQRMGDSLNTLIADYNRAETSLSPAARQTRQAAIRTREEEYQRRTQQLEQQAQQRQAQLVQPILQQIGQVIDAVRNEEGYAFVFDVAAEGRTIVAADKNLDITDRVVARVQALPRPAALPAPGATPAATPTRPTPGAPLGAPAGVTRPPTRPRP